MNLPERYNELRHEGRDRDQACTVLAREFGIKRAEVSRQIAQACRDGLLPDWKIGWWNSTPEHYTDTTAACLAVKERTRLAIEDAALLWQRYYSPGTFGYRPTIEKIAGDMGLNPRTVQRYISVARSQGLIR